MGEKPFWRPDYIIIAGDLVDAKDKNYNLVKKHLNSFINDADFHINKFHFITVPGNHDKDFSYLNKKGEERTELQKKEREKYESFVSDMDSDKFKFDIKANFDENFRSYGSFYLNYVKTKNKKNYKYIVPEEYLGNDLNNVALTSGLKIFEESKTCFLSINTEWVYFPEDSRTDSTMKKICPQLVLSSINEYYKKYLDYSLITIMHRSPYELSWIEKNSKFSNTPDILRSIYNYSDIILSGHDHVEKVLSPHMMENKAQLFQLGSASVSSRGNNKLPQYIATLIHMDAIDRSLKICNFEYDYNNERWGYKEDPNSYPLQKHFKSETTPSFSLTDKNATYLRIKVHSTALEDIKAAIQSLLHELKKSKYSVFFHNINDETFNLIKSLKKEGKTFIFVCCFSDLDHSHFHNLLDSLYEHDDIRGRIYKKQLIIKELFVELSSKIQFECSNKRE